MGIQTVKVVVLQDGAVTARTKEFSGFEPTKAAEQAFAEALQTAGIQQGEVGLVLATGSGMDMAPYSNGNVSMMGADARAGVHLFPAARTIIDVGAEEARAVKCDERGIMQDFVVNERCAAGAGTFIEAMARALEVKMEDMGPLSLQAERASPINASCAVFDAMADRVSSMVHRLGINPEVVLVGGVAKDVGFIASLKRKLGINILVPEDPEYVGALGAALTAASRKGGVK
jgi:benzoyl-CoA reductase subunit D